MKATKDIRVPSEVTKVNTFLDLIGHNKIDTIDMAVLNYNSTYNGKLVGKPQRLRDSMIKKGLDENTDCLCIIFYVFIQKSRL